MTFPGESLAVFDVGGAFSDWEAVAFRAGSSTLTSGDSAWADVGLYPYLLTGGDDAVVSWVVEVLSGTGTLDLSEDAGSLGSHPVTTGTLVVESALTVADVVAGGSARLTIECTSGTVEVQQVKLRVWPPGGVVGGLSPVYQPPAVDRPVTYRLAAQAYVTPTFLTGSDIDDVMDATQQELRGEFGGTPLGSPGFVDTETLLGAGFYATVTETYGGVPPVSGNGEIGGGVAYLERSDPFVPNPPGDFGVDWTYPPNEVADDPDKWVVVGDDSWGWWQGVATVVVTVVDDFGPAGGTFRVGGDNVTGLDSPADTFGEITDEANVIAGIPADDIDQHADVDMPAWSDDNPLIRLSFWHDGAKEPAEVVHIDSDVFHMTKTTGNARAALWAGRIDGEDFYPLLAAYTAGAYRYWTLTVTTPQPHQIFQRKDTLGAGPALLYDPATRQATGLIYGTY